MKRALLSLLRLFPPAFRAQFGADMAEQIERDLAQAREAGRGRGLAFGVTTGVDLVVSAAAERLRPTWLENGRTGSEREFMAALDGWTRDLRQSVRALRRAPGFTAIAVGTLGLAIGATAGIFSVVNGVLLDPLPYANADRLVYIAASAPGSDFPEEFGVAAEFVLQYGESPLLENVAMYNAFTATLRVDDRAERVRMSTPTVSLFETLGAQPALGRLSTEEDEGQTVVISHALWSTWFGSDPGVLGRTVYTSFGNRTIVGVMGPEFRFPVDDIMLWVPNTLRADAIRPGQFGGGMVARTKPGVTHEALVTELTTLAQRLPERFGGPASYVRLIEQHRPIVRSLREQVLGDISRPLWVLLGSVAIVLLIACANVANLFLVRAERRHRDLAIRRAIGAGRARLFRAEMSEALLVAITAGGLAVALAWATVPPFLRAAPSDIPRLADVHLTPVTVAFTVLVSLFTGLVCGLIPALHSSSPNLERLRDGSRGSTSRRHWGRDGLVVAQTALALVLLIGSGLLVRSFLQLRNVDPGYETEDIFTFQMAPETIDGAEAWARFHYDFLDRLRALPGVESVGIVENVPLNESTRISRFVTPEMGGEADAGPLLRWTMTGGDYFRTMDIAVLAGRPLEEADHFTQRGNVVISESAARLLFPGEDPLGRTIRHSGLDTWETVVGVVEDVRQDGFREDPEPLVYFPLVAQNPDTWELSSPAYVVKTPRAETIAPEIRTIVREMAPEAPMYRVFTMAGLAADSMVHLSFTMLTLGVTSLLALILGMVGLYGVLSYVVAQRTREIGVRMALGAEAGRVRRMVVVQGVRVVVIGVAIGALVAFASTPALGSLLFGVESADLTTFLAMSAAMLGVGLLASWVPAWRASRVDPLTSLRE